MPACPIACLPAALFHFLPPLLPPAATLPPAALLSPPADLNIAYKMPIDEYQRLCPYSEALEENWGKPPGNLNTNGQEMLIYGKQFGNVFIGVQPTFGYEGDPMRLLFSRSASPHHGFAAYYTFLEKIFGVGGVAACLSCPAALRMLCRPCAGHAVQEKGLTSHGLPSGQPCRLLDRPAPLTCPSSHPPLPAPLPTPPHPRRPTRCCTLAPTAPWSSCPASRWA